MTGVNSHSAYVQLEARLRTLLPETYQDTYEEVQPVSMGSAGLKFSADGRVAWDEIWGSFCDLAMAGGPPHRGKLLQPGTAAEIELHLERHAEVVEELCRGIEMTTGLAGETAEVAGWVQVDCPSRSMAGWLARAINMENVSAHVGGMALHLPAGPEFRLEKEIKNVIVSIAKTCHYWLGHTSVSQHRAIGELFEEMECESPLLQAPLFVGETTEACGEKIAMEIAAQMGLRASGREYAGWLGVDCGNVQSAVWMMRMMVASNVTARREGNFLYVPIDPVKDEEGSRIMSRLGCVYGMACGEGVMTATQTPR